LIILASVFITSGLFILDSPKIWILKEAIAMVLGFETAPLPKVAHPDVNRITVKRKTTFIFFMCVFINRKTLAL
jgi:hypothetical protein